jgi:hypothetical protein
MKNLVFEGKVRRWDYSLFAERSLGQPQPAEKKGIPGFFIGDVLKMQRRQGSRRIDGVLFVILFRPIETALDAGTAAETNSFRIGVRDVRG